MKRLVLLLLALAVGMFIFVAVDAIGGGGNDASRGLFRLPGDNPRIKAIGQSFRTKSWKAEEKTKAQEKKEEEKVSSTKLTLDKSISSNKDIQLNDPVIGALLDKEMAAIEASGLDENETVLGQLADSISMNENDFDYYYRMALSANTIEEFYDLFPRNPQALEIFMRSREIKRLIEANQ